MRLLGLPTTSFIRISQKKILQSRSALLSAAARREPQPIESPTQVLRAWSRHPRISQEFSSPTPTCFPWHHRSRCGIHPPHCQADTLNRPRQLPLSSAPREYETLSAWLVATNSRLPA